MSDAFINATSDGGGRASVEIHDGDQVIDISHLLTSVTWTMEAQQHAQLTLVARDPGRVEVEAALPDGVTVQVVGGPVAGACRCVRVHDVGNGDSLLPSAEECPVHQRS